MKKSLIAAIGLLYLLAGCQKKLPLSDFIDDYNDYQPEIRIEAIMDPVHPQKSIVRADRSIRIDDTEIYNGLDDDGDWIGYSDLNENGQWDSSEPLNDDLGEDGLDSRDFNLLLRDAGEGNGLPDQGEPHVDEYDEILPLIHDSTATVTFTRLCDGMAYNFYWQSIADTFDIISNRNMNNEDPEFVSYTYGAYMPLENMMLDCNVAYRFTIEFNDPTSHFYGKVVTGETTPLPPPVFLDIQSGSLNDYNSSDTIYIEYGDTNFIVWTSDIQTSTYFVQMEQYFSADSQLMTYSHPSFPFDVEPFITLFPDRRTGIETLTSQVFPGLYKLTVSVMDQAFGNYYYSDLDLDDPKKSNLRDENGDPIMGVAGSIAPAFIWIRIN